MTSRERTPEQEREFRDWKNRADEADMMLVAVKHGRAALKKAGQEFIGPCPCCNGRDRFSVNQGKRKWNCRGHGGGNGPIGMLMHIAGLSFLEACEEITGDPPPRGEAKPLTEEQKAERERRRAESLAAQERRAAEVAAERDMNAAEARDVWDHHVVRLDGTLAERYLMEDRKIPRPPMGWPDTLGFCRSLQYGRSSGRYHPALVGRGQHISGETVAIHAVYLTPKGQKVALDPPKLTYGPSIGAAVRLGGSAPHFDGCEGLETGMGIRWIINHQRPVWCGLGTAGLAHMQVPDATESVTLWPDGDVPIKRHGNSFLPVEVAPGIKAARTLRDRLVTLGISVPINEPPIADDGSADFLNVWQSMQEALRAEA